MVHRNAGLTPAGKRILVQRVPEGRPAAYVAKDRSSRPRSCQHATATAKIEEVLAARVKHREGPVELGERCQVPARTVSRILARSGLPRLWELDPISGERIRAGRPPTTATNATPPWNCCILTSRNSAKSRKAEAGASMAAAKA
jgi:hypothetical protein